jgi:hypothetical protein
LFPWRRRACSGSGARRPESWDKLLAGSTPQMFVRLKQMTLDRSHCDPKPSGCFRMVQIIDPIEEKGVAALRREFVQKSAELAEFNGDFDRHFRTVGVSDENMELPFVFGVTGPNSLTTLCVDRQIGGDTEKIRLGFPSQGDVVLLESMNIGLLRDIVGLLRADSTDEKVMQLPSMEPAEVLHDRV